MVWLTAASGLPGKALAVGMAVWYLVGMSKTNEVRLSGVTLKLFHVGRKAGYAGLLALEAAGLVQVERRPGSCPVVQVLDGRSPEQN